MRHVWLYDFALAEAASELTQTRWDGNARFNRQIFNLFSAVLYTWSTLTVLQSFFIPAFWTPSFSFVLLLLDFHVSLTNLAFIAPTFPILPANAVSSAWREWGRSLLCHIRLRLFSRQQRNKYKTVDDITSPFFILTF